MLGHLLVADMDAERVEATKGHWYGQRSTTSPSRCRTHLQRVPWR